MSMSKTGVMNRQILNSKVRFMESPRAVSRLKNFIKKSLIEKTESQIVRYSLIKSDF